MRLKDWKGRNRVGNFSQLPTKWFYKEWEIAEMLFSVCPSVSDPCVTDTADWRHRNVTKTIKKGRKLHRKEEAEQERRFFPLRNTWNTQTEQRAGPETARFCSQGWSCSHSSSAQRPSMLSWAISLNPEWCIMGYLPPSNLGNPGQDCFSVLSSINVIITPHNECSSSWSS